MPDEVGTETTRSDAPSVDDSLFGDAPDDTTAAEPVAEDATQDAPPDRQDAGDGAAQDGEGSGEETPESEDLKVVLSIKGGRATIGVQKPSADPHIETFDDRDLGALAQEVPAVTERARARWEETPKHPAYERPAPPARRRNRRQQGAAQEATAEAETEPQQQQTLRLF